MCKQITKIRLPGENDTLEGREIKKAFKNKTELCFETFGSDDVYGLIEKLNDKYCAWIMNVKVTKIGSTKVKGKEWEAHYDPDGQYGMFWDKK